MFQQIRGIRIPEEIAAQIRERILSGRLRPDERLPSEKELAEHFGTGRGTVREALRSLEAAGLLVVRRGAQGGPYVASSSLEQVGESLSDALRLGSTPVVELTEARLVLEPTLARLAAERASQEDLDQIRRSIEAAAEALSSGQNPRRQNLEFHRAVARAAKNSVLLVSLNSTIVVLAEAVEKLRLTMDSSGHVVDAHRRIYQALEAHDPALAFREMEQHVLELHANLWGVSEK